MRIRRVLVPPKYRIYGRIPSWSLQKLLINLQIAAIHSNLKKIKPDELV